MLQQELDAMEEPEEEPWTSWRARLEMDDALLVRARLPLGQQAAGRLAAQ